MKRCSARLVALCAMLAARAAFGADPPAPAVSATSQGGAITPGSREDAQRLEAEALTEFQARDYPQAEARLREALAIRRSVVGERDPATLATMASLAGVLDYMERLPEAAQLYGDALRLQRKVLGDRHRDTIGGIGLYAGVLMEQGKFAEAEQLYAEALKAQREVPGERDDDTVSTLNNYAEAIGRQGRYAEAGPIFGEALRLSREVHGARAPVTLNRLNNYAANLNRQGRLTEAAAIQADVVRDCRAVLGDRDPFTLTAISNYASMLRALGRQRDALPVAEQALQLRRELLGPEHPDTLTSLGNYAGLLQDDGRFEEAEPLQAQVLRLRRKVSGPDHPETINALNNYGFVLFDLGRFAQAEPLFEEALKLNRTVLGERHPLTLTSMTNYAAVLDETGRLKEAEALDAAALQARRETLGNDHPDTLSSLNNEAYQLERIGRLAESEQLYAEALALWVARLGPRHPDTVVAAANLAAVRLQLPGKWAHAIEPARIAAAGQAYNDGGAGSGGGSAGGGATRQARHDTDSALVHSLLAEADWAARAPTAASDAGPTQAERADRPDKLRDEAFAALQQTLINTTTRAASRSAALRAAVRVGLGAAAGEREALIDRRATLDAAIVRSFGQGGTAADGERATLRADLRRVDERIAVLDGELRRRAPDYYALVRPAAVSLAEAAALLKPDEAALVLVPARTSTQVMLVTREGLRWHRSPLAREAIDKLVRRLLWDVGGDVQPTAVEAATWGDEGAGATPYDFRSAYALYHELIEPIAAGLEGKTQLFVSSSGSLSSLPLGILVSEIPKGDDGDPEVLRGAKWLADRVAISVIPSLQSLQFIRQFRGSKDARKASAASYLGFGDPVLDGVASQRGGAGASARGGAAGPSLARVFAGSAARGSESAMASPAELRKLARLPETRVEIENQWLAFGKPANAVFLAEAATETQVKHASLSAGVISFATHGLLAGELQGAAEPGLVLTPPATASAEDDGFLTASEIAALKIDAGWVLLSACNTAASDGSAGAPGLSGLSRAFFFAGATNLLVSHWPVRDDVASKLTVRAIEIARDNPGFSRAKAVQRAEQEIRSNAAHDTPRDSWAHPSAWAPFSLVGDGAS